MWVVIEISSKSAIVLYSNILHKNDLLLFCSFVGKIDLKL